MGKEVKVGETISVGFKMLKCVVTTGPRCTGCYLRGLDNCLEIIGCCSGSRKDNTNVIFEEVHMTDYSDKNGIVLEDGSIIKLWIKDDIEPEGGCWCYLYVTCVPSKGFVLWGDKITIEDAEPLECWKSDLENCEVVGNINRIRDYEKFFK